MSSWQINCKLVPVVWQKIFRKKLTIKINLCYIIHFNINNINNISLRVWFCHSIGHMYINRKIKILNLCSEDFRSFMTSLWRTFCTTFILIVYDCAQLNTHVVTECATIWPLVQVTWSMSHLSLNLIRWPSLYHILNPRLLVCSQTFWSQCMHIKQQSTPAELLELFNISVWRSYIARVIRNNRH